MFFFDESRFGTHSKIGHGWFQKGSRTPVSVKLGFENFYLYGAVDPLSGEHCTLLLPNVNTVCMNIFLQELGAQYRHHRVILVVDGASWHKARSLSLPQNIEILYLPPYSPELNPIERLWNYIKARILRNKTYNNIEDLKDAVCRFLVALESSLLQSVCSCPYLFN